MTDIHCHILPGVDDGAESLADSLEMARMAAESGVHTIVATPHCNLPDAPEDNYASPELARRFAQLRRAIEAEGIPLELLPGAEVLCTPQVPELLREGRLLTLASSRYLLMEFYFDESLEYMDQMLSAVAAEGYIPVLAHPERYQAVQEAPRVIQRWFWDGHIIQLNKGSILGRLGRGAQRCSEWILSCGLAHTVASDAHTPTVRTPHMAELTDRLYSICPPEYVSVLLDENPGNIVKNLPVVKA